MASDDLPTCPQCGGLLIGVAVRGPDERSGVPCGCPQPTEETEG